jgi:hypothetical protein
MLTFDFPLPEVGSILVTGYEANMQSTLARHVAAHNLLAGGSVVYLTDFETEGGEVIAGLRDWFKSQAADASVIERASFLHNYRQCREPEELRAKIEAKRRTAHKPVLIVCDRGKDTLQLLPGASWLNLAEQLALLMDCRVLSVGHHGPSGPPAPDYAKYNADMLLTCEAGLNLALTIRERKPGDAVIRLKGKALPFGAIGLTNIPQEEVSHAFG